VLLCEAETRREEALSVFDCALEHFRDEPLLQFNSELSEVASASMPDPGRDLVYKRY
jgi:hypothetical protein